MTKFLTILFSFTLVLTAAANTVVATVGSRKITQQELDEAYRQNLLFVSDKVVTKEKVLNDLINREIGIQKAKKQKLDENDTVKKKMEDVLYHAQISKDLEPRLKEINVTDEDVKKYYRDFPEYRTAHILFRIRPQPEKEEFQAALTQAMKVYRELEKNPKLFAELANKFSQSSTAPNGGDIGFQPAVRLAPEYFQNIKGKPVDTILPPVRTQFGYHIIKVLAVKEYDEINKTLYKKIVYDKKRDKILEGYFAEMRKSYPVKVLVNVKN